MSVEACPCGFGLHSAEGVRAFTAEWHRQHQVAHLGAYPVVDMVTRLNLVAAIRNAERREASRKVS